MGKDKKPKPFEGVTQGQLNANGPYTWGNGPKPEGKLVRLIKRLRGK